jgi:RNA polymerase sigma-70 factor (ECF subfamily)
MSTVAEVFESNRTRLFRIAYRMLKSRADAEDALQEAFLRWHQSSGSLVQRPTAFLITVITRLCLDRLRRLKKERDRGEIDWLPEPVMGDYAASPEAHSEIARDVAVAFVAVLECLGAAERTVFLLHDVFDFDYPEVAQIVFKSEPACRQLVRRVHALACEMLTLGSPLRQSAESAFSTHSSPPWTQVTARRFSL